MTAVRFVIPGKPFAKQRARSFFNKNLGRAVTVDTPGNRSFEATVRELAVPHFPAALTGPLAVEIVAVFCPASSWSKKRRAAAMGTHHTQKPDADNIAKATKDGLNRVAWGDDCQVAELHVIKLWGEREETRVTIERIGE